MKNFTRLILFLLAMVVGSQVTIAQCTSDGGSGNGQYPTGTIAVGTTCAPVTVTTLAYTGEYSRLSGTAAQTYTYTSSVATDFITITDVATNTPIAWGVTPLSYTFAAPPGDIFLYRNDNSSCAWAGGQSSRTIQVTCTSCASAGTPLCTTNTAPANNATGVSLTPTITWAAATNAVSYDIYLGTSVAGATLLGNTAATSAVITAGAGLVANTQYFWYVIPKACDGTSPSTCTANATSFTTQGLPPANDDCAAAVTLTPQPFQASGCPSSVSGTTVNATLSATPSSATWPSSSDDDVWYTFTATSTAPIVRFCNVTYPVGAAVAMNIGLHTSCSAAEVTGTGLSVTPVAGTGSISLTGLAIGTTYWMRVLTSGTTSRANFDISILNPPPPPDCATLNTPTNGATGVVRNTPLTWTAASTGGTATAFKVYLGTVNPPTTLVSTITAPTATYTPTGQTYNTVYYWYIVPTGPGGDAVGCNATVNSYTTELAPPGPANDNCAGATAFPTIPTDGTCVTLSNQTNASATASGVTPTGACSSNSGTPDDDVWFSFVAPGSTVILSSTWVSGATDIYWQVFSSACGSTMTSILCTDTDAGGTLTGLTTGATYYIRLYTWVAATTTTQNICLKTPPPPPANDNCAGATAFPTIPTDGTCITLSNQTNASATASGVTPTGVCSSNSGTPDDDVWFSFVAPATSLILSSTWVSGVTDIYWQVFSSACGSSMTSILCTDTDAGGTLTGLTIGATYYIRLYTWAAISTTTQNICLKTPPPMTYTSSAITHPTFAGASAGSTYQSILRLAVVTANAANPLQVTQLDFTTAGTPGTSTPADLTNARVYYTSTTSTFTDGAPAGTQFGSTIVNPSGAMSFVGTQTLTTGTNYFWLVYDLACGAVGPNIDASMVTNGLTMTGGPYTPTTPDPANNRTVTALTAFSTAANGSWSTPGTWACGVPPAGTTVPININHNVTLDVDVDVQSTVTVAASRTLTLNTNTLGIGTGGTGTKNLSISGTVSVGGGTLNVGTSAGVTTSNISIASGGTLSISSGTINLGPTGGYLRSLSNSGTLTVAGGVLNVNGSVSISSTFNQSGGDINIDGNGGTAGSSVASGTAMLSMTSALGTTTGGTITIVDPNFNSGGKAVDYNVSSTARTWATAHVLNIGDGISSQSSSNTSGFILESYTGTGRLTYGTLNIKGGSTTNRWASLGVWGINVGGTMTVDAGSEIRLGSTSVSPVFVGNIVNNGTITSTVNITLAGISGNNVVVNPNAQTISGSGVWRNLVSSPTANLNSLTVNNSNSNPIALPASMITGTGTGSISSTLTLTSGKLDVTSGALTVGISTASTGTISGGSSSTYVIGELRKWRASGTGSQVFPVGSSSTYYPATVNFPTTGPSVGGTNNVQFISGDPGSAGLPAADPSGTNPNCFAACTTGYWQIDAGNGLTGGTYNLDLTATSFPCITTLADARILKRPTAGGNWTFNGTHGTNTAGNVIKRVGLSGFSQFAISQGSSTPLPIELKSFTGKALKASNQLEWITSTEEGVKEHIIERSANGYNNWTLVGTTPSKGDARVDQSYSMEDKTPLTKSFYRLRSLDLDGREQFSNVISLTRQNNSFGVIAAYPNPAVEMINVQFNTLEEGNITARIVDMTGRLVLEQQMSALNGTNMFPVQLHGLSAGTYFITLSSDNEVAEPIRFVKQ